MNEAQANINPSLKKTYWQRVFSNIFFWWLGITVVYWILVHVTGDLYITNKAGLKFLILNYVTGIFGLFTPIGPNNIFIALFLPITWLLGVGMIIIFWALEKYLGEKNINVALKIIINLVVLLAITLVVDLILLGEWTSLKILLSGGIDRSYFPRFR